ncbi:MAG TPA: AIR synthase related protein [Turneriella sp.]|nr:AIR synthase related protein [Turneriella sp.]
MPSKKQESILSEEEILTLLRSLKASKKNSISGDDIAAFDTHPRAYAATDSLIENTHYKRTWLLPKGIAYKLFARNWSDFLCKGILPRYALLNLNLSRKSATLSFLSPFLHELDHLLVRHKMILIGGDTAYSQTDVFTLTLLGSEGTFIPRCASSIQVGDCVVQLGAVGASDWARKCLMRKITDRMRTLFARPHLFAKLPSRHNLKAALHQSDSVDKTLHILAAQNRVTLAIDVDAIDVYPRVQKGSHAILSAAEDLALFGIATKTSSAFRVIGRVVSSDSHGVVYRHRGKIVTYAGGFEHFKN